MSIQAKEIEFSTFPDDAGQGPPVLNGAQALPFLGALKVKLTARVGEKELSVADLMALKAGSTIDLDSLLEQPIDLLAEGHVVARGMLVAVDDHFGVRLTTAPTTVA